MTEATESMPRTLYVGGIDFDTQPEELQRLFTPFGALSQVHVPLDKMTGRSKSFGFVTYERDTDLNAAIQFVHGSNFRGRILTVNRARKIEARRPLNGDSGSHSSLHRDILHYLRVDKSLLSRPDASADIGEVILPDSVSLDDLHAVVRPPVGPLDDFDLNTPKLRVLDSITDEYIKWLACHPNELRSPFMLPRRFEELVAGVAERYGYVVNLTKQTHDGGYDIIAIRNDLVQERLLIECKHYVKTRSVTIGMVRALHGVKIHEKATKAVLATTARFTRPAVRFIEEHMWELEGKGYDELCTWLMECPYRTKEEH